MSRNVGRESSRDMIRWEKSYWFSTAGQFLLASVFFGIEKNQFDSTLFNFYHNW